MNQRILIERGIKENGFEHVVCGTVHAFQGDEKDVVLFSTALSDRTGKGTYDWLKNNKELINVATSRAKDKLILLADGKELERLHQGNEDDDLYELVQYVKMNGESKITEKHISSRALGIQPFSTETEAAFMKNLTHALENIWLTRNKYTIHKEVAISQVFRDNVTYDNLFYMGRFDFVVYEKRGKSELPVLRSNSTARSILRMKWYGSGTDRKMRSVRRIICRSSVWKTLMQDAITTSRKF